MSDSIIPLRKENLLLEAALKKRAEYLERNPHMVKVQEEIEGVLAKAGSKVENRQAAVLAYFRGLTDKLVSNIEGIQADIKNMP